mgnify:CR=1 FL=1
MRNFLKYARMSTTTHPDTHSYTQELTAGDLRKIQALVQHQNRLCDQMQDLAQEHRQPVGAPVQEPVALWDSARPEVPDQVHGLMEQLKSSKA